MSFADILCRVLLVLFALHYIYRLVRDDSARKRARNRYRRRTDFDPTVRTPYWSNDLWRR